MAHDIFISYSRLDTEVVQQFYDQLTALGYVVWIDRDGIESGDAFKKVIVRAIKESRCVVFFSSKNSNASEWTIKEISVAVHKKIPIVPVKLDQTDYSEDLEFDLIRLDFTDFSQPDIRELQMNRFLKSIQKKFPISRSEDTVDPTEITKPADETFVEESTQDDKAAISDTEEKDAEAQYNLGVKYRFNDMQKAVFWFSKAAEQGHVEAQFNLGEIYRHEQNMEQAVFWYSKAAKQGHAISQYYMGRSHRLGIGVDKDLDKAFLWYTKSAEQGNAFAQSMLGLCYKQGIGVRPDPVLAVHWYTRSAEQGNAIAQYNLGICYETGFGVDTNLKTAIQWYTKAAEQGNADAQFSLGTCYEKGLGVKKNVNTAALWYYKAAKQGHQKSENALQKCKFKSRKKTKGKK